MLQNMDKYKNRMIIWKDERKTVNLSEISENAIRVRKQRKITLQLEARPASHLSEKQSQMTSID